MAARWQLKSTHAIFFTTVLLTAVAAVAFAQTRDRSGNRAQSANDEPAVGEQLERLINRLVDERMQRIGRGSLVVDGLPSGQIQLDARHDLGINIIRGSKERNYCDHLEIGFLDGRPCIMLCDAAKTHGGEKAVIDLYELAKEHGKTVRTRWYTEDVQASMDRVAQDKADNVRPNRNGRTDPRANRAARRRTSVALSLTPSLQRTTPGHATLVYDPKTGDVTVNSDNPDGNKFSSVMVKSAAGRFRYKNATWYPVDGHNILNANELFRVKAVGGGFPKGDVLQGYYMGNILPEGLSVEDLLQDLTVDGAYFTKGGGLNRYCPSDEEGVLLYVAPDGSDSSEPAALELTQERASEPSGRPPQDEGASQPDDSLRRDTSSDIEPDNVPSVVAVELRELREEVRAMSETIKELTKRVEAAGHER